MEEYLSFVAKTGDPVFLWSKVKFLFQQKLQHVFAPFTIQRLCELLTSPRKEYNRTDKFMRAVEKNILVVTTREPLAGCRDVTPSPVVNGVDASSSTEQAGDRSEAMEVESTGKAGASRFADSREDEPAAASAQFTGESSRSPASCPEQHSKSPDELNGMDEDESDEDDEASEEEDASEEDEGLSGTAAASAGKVVTSPSHGSSNSNSSSSSSSSTGSPLADSSPVVTDTHSTSQEEAPSAVSAQEDTSESTSSLLEEDRKTPVESGENTSSGAASPVECDNDEATTSPQPQSAVGVSADALEAGPSSKMPQEESEKTQVQKREHPTAENDSSCLVSSPPSKRVCIEGVESVNSATEEASTSPDNSACTPLVCEDSASSSSSKSEATNLSNGTDNQEQ
ncbi:hypothetical protein B566_EDAN014324 [Ephemera danica]|nr:hypothetical protein B566_EDAN014324 [Ephemera danica]